MSTLKNKLMVSGTALGLFISFGTVSSAQDNSDELKAKRLDEIVVTARKRAENIQETPLSISAFTADMIEAAAIRDLADVAKFTPGFSLDDEFGRTSGVRPVIRGQATILGASGVSTFVDGILLNGSILDYDLTDVERIEVVKGPQSALYGRNTYSGAINIITKSPSDEFSGDVKVDGGKFGRFELGGTIRGPISDTVSANLHGRYFTRGGPFTNTFDGTDIGQQESGALSLALFYEPTDRLNARARIRLSKLHDDQPRLFSQGPSENNIFQDNGPVYNGNSRYFAGEITNRPIAYDDVRILGEKGFEDTEALQASLSINYELNDQVNMEFINGFNADNNESKFDFDHTAASLGPLLVNLGAFFPVGVTQLDQFSVVNNIPLIDSFGNPRDPAPTCNQPALDPFFSNLDFSNFCHFAVAVNPADFASVGKSTSDDHSHELRFNYDAAERWTGMIGGYYFQGSSKFEGTRQAPAGLADIFRSDFALQNANFVDICLANPFTPCAAVPGGATVGYIVGPNFLDDPEAIIQSFTLDADRSIIESERRNLAIFGSLDFDVTEQLTVTAEARYKSERIKTSTISRTAVYNFNGTQTDFVVEPDVRREETFTSFNPRFTAKYQANENINVYAIAARGDKPGGFNNANAIPLGFGSYDEETVWAFEGGVKNTFMDGTLILNLAGFHNSISDYQLTQATTFATGETTTVISNVGKVRVQGLEAEMTYRVPSIPGLILNANYALADSKIRQGTDLNEGRHLDVDDDGLLNCSTGFENPDSDNDPTTPDVCLATGDNVLFGSIVGRQLPRSPKHTFNVGMNYTRALTEVLDFNLNANVSHESKKFVQVHNLAFVGDNTLVNGSIGISTNGISFTIWGRNLTNEDAVVSAQRFTDPNQSFQRAFIGNPRLPREYGATFRKTF